MTNPDKCSYCQGLQRELAACKCSGGSGVVPDEVPEPFELSIEKGIPVPVPRATYRDVIGSMEVNDSILTDDRSRFSHVFTHFREQGWKFTQRQQPSGKVRIWRIA